MSRTSNGTKAIEAMQLQKQVTSRKIFVMRHGERLDKEFPHWMQLGWTKDGRYKPYDLNMPSSLPTRANYLNYATDSPLTELGYITSQICGTAIRRSGQTVTHVYSSPALRCLQSAHGVLKHNNDKTVQIQVEPALFDWLGWYKDEIPTFMTLDEYAKVGYKVNREYEPVMTVQQLKANAAETIEAYYNRSNAIMKAILEKHPCIIEKTPCNILVLCHAPSLDACCRELRGKRPSLPTIDQMNRMNKMFPYGATVVLEEFVDKSWDVAERPLPSFTCFEQNTRIDAQFFNRP